jgi:hypothetical protein
MFNQLLCALLVCCANKDLTTAVVADRVRATSTARFLSVSPCLFSRLGRCQSPKAEAMAVTRGFSARAAAVTRRA